MSAQVAAELRNLAAEVRNAKAALDFHAHNLARWGHDDCAMPIDGPVGLLRHVYDDLIHQAERLEAGELA